MLSHLGNKKETKIMKKIAGRRVLTICDLTRNGKIFQISKFRCSFCRRIKKVNSFCIVNGEPACKRCYRRCPVEEINDNE